MKTRKFAAEPAPPTPGESPADNLRRQVDEWRARDELFRRRPADVEEARRDAVKRKLEAVWADGGLQERGEEIVGVF